MTPLDETGLDLLFRAARTHNAWDETAISDATLAKLYELLKFGPTSANSSPARFVFVKSKEAKEKLRPLFMEGNREKTMAAPVCVIIGYDTKFYEHLPKLFPHNLDAKNWFAHSAALAEETAFRNSTLQGAYLMMAARALGLDCGPMSGFDKAGVDAAFFPGGRVKSNFICALGQGRSAGLFARSPRFSFDEVCQIV